MNQQRSPSDRDADSCCVHTLPLSLPPPYPPSPSPPPPLSEQLCVAMQSSPGLTAPFRPQAKTPFTGQMQREKGQFYKTTRAVAARRDFSSLEAEEQSGRARKAEGERGSRRRGFHWKEETKEPWRSIGAAELSELSGPQLPHIQRRAKTNFGASSWQGTLSSQSRIKFLCRELKHYALTIVIGIQGTVLGTAR